MDCRDARFSSASMRLDLQCVEHYRYGVPSGHWEQRGSRSNTIHFMSGRKVLIRFDAIGSTMCRTLPVRSSIWSLRTERFSKQYNPLHVGTQGSHPFRCDWVYNVQNRTTNVRRNFSIPTKNTKSDLKNNTPTKDQRKNPDYPGINFT